MLACIRAFSASSVTSLGLGVTRNPPSCDVTARDIISVVSFNSPDSSRVVEKEYVNNKQPETHRLGSTM